MHTPPGNTFACSYAPWAWGTPDGIHHGAPNATHGTHPPCCQSIFIRFDYLRFTYTPHHPLTIPPIFLLYIIHWHTGTYHFMCPSFSLSCPLPSLSPQMKPQSVLSASISFWIVPPSPTKIQKQKKQQQRCTTHHSPSFQLLG